MSFYKNHILPKLLNSAMRKAHLERLRAGVVENAAGLVLEIGFGSGLNLPHYKNIEKLYALDPSEELFALAKERMKDFKYPIEQLAVGAEKIPLSDDSVDTVVSTWTLCTIPDVRSALKEMRRVLKPHGRYLFIEHGKSPVTFWGRLQSLITPISRHFTGGCHLDREIEDLIREAGFKIEKLEKFSLKNKPLAYMYKGIAVK